MDYQFKLLDNPYILIFAKKYINFLIIFIKYKTKYILNSKYILLLISNRINKKI